MDNTLYLQLQKEAEEIAQKASQLLISYENTFTTVNQKDIGDMATSADIASEKLIIEEIRKIHPNHSILSEEAGELPGTEPYTWIIDPLDGTKEYFRHASEYNCLIAVEKNKNLVVGVIKRNGVNEMYICSKGNGSFLNKKPIHVSNIENLDTAFVSFYLPIKSFPRDELDKDLALLVASIHTCYRVRGNNDEAKAFAWVARGIYDGHIYVPRGGEWHDVASGLLLVEEAGGMISDFYGNPIVDRNLSNGVVASNGKIHKQLLELIGKVI